ncbi:MAG: hypothetical protein FD174_2906 [Geobacteraceae bacterium]|nr:MAG: hypothetical protein FD174_2906 [Geobacteraceae bacterium]
MELVEEMQTYYGKRAPVYDNSMGYDDHGTVKSLEPVIKRIRGLLDGRKILEIACGPCFWTQRVSEVAESILATDFNDSTLDQARRKNLDWDKVALQCADAYDLSRVQGVFDAALAVDWFAHVPRSRFHEFLRGLHGRLQAGSIVVLCDQSPGVESLSGMYDQEGNHLQTRDLPDGSKCRVIKNFLSELEFKELFARYSSHVEIASYPECRRIVVSYTLKT